MSISILRIAADSWRQQFQQDSLRATATVGRFSVTTEPESGDSPSLRSICKCAVRRIELASPTRQLRPEQHTKLVPLRYRSRPATYSISLWQLRPNENKNENYRFKVVPGECRVRIRSDWCLEVRSVTSTVCTPIARHARRKNAKENRPRLTLLMRA